eukprot:gene22574-30098_t
MACFCMSIRWLTILLAFSCIVITAAVCTYLSIASGDNALEGARAVAPVAVPTASARGLV